MSEKVSDKVSGNSSDKASGRPSDKASRKNSEKPVKKGKGLKGLMASMFKIGCVGFGGGSALIPVIEKEVVDEQHLVSKKEYDKDVIVACITPGALPVEIATGLGKRAGGVRGMLGAALLMAFPGVLFTIVLLSVFSNLDKALLTQIECLSIGLSSLIACLLTQYCVSSMEEAKEESRGRLKRAFIIMAGVFILTCGKNIYKIFGAEGNPVFALSTVQVLGIAFFGILYTHCHFTVKNTIVSCILIVPYILCAGKCHVIANVYVKYVLIAIMAVLSAYGLYTSIADYNGGKNTRKKGTSPKSMIQEVTAWICVLIVLSIPALIITKDTWVYALRGLVSSVISFGGGDAYLSVADGMFVDTGTLTSSEFYGQLVPVANVLPGSILCKMLAGIGYFMGYNLKHSVWQGILVSLCGFACSVMASGTVTCVIYYVYETFEHLDVFSKISRWIRPIIAGLLLNIMISMVYQNISTGSSLSMSPVFSLVITALVYGADMYLLLAKKKSNGFLIIVSAVLGLLLCNITMLVF